MTYEQTQDTVQKSDDGTDTDTDSNTDTTAPDATDIEYAETSDTCSASEQSITVTMLSDIIDCHASALHAAHRCQMDCRTGVSIFPRGFVGADKDHALAVIEDKWYNGGRTYLRRIIDSYTDYEGESVCDDIESEWK